MSKELIKKDRERYLQFIKNFGNITINKYCNEIKVSQSNLDRLKYDDIIYIASRLYEDLKEFLESV